VAIQTSALTSAAMLVKQPRRRVRRLSSLSMEMRISPMLRNLERLDTRRITESGSLKKLNGRKSKHV